MGEGRGSDIAAYSNVQRPDGESAAQDALLGESAEVDGRGMEQRGQQARAVPLLALAGVWQQERDTGEALYPGCLPGQLQESGKPVETGHAGHGPPERVLDGNVFVSKAGMWVFNLNTSNVETHGLCAL